MARPTAGCLTGVHVVFLEVSLPLLRRLIIADGVPVRFVLFVVLVLRRAATGMFDHEESAIRNVAG